MSNGVLTQEEIDALLNAAISDGGDAPAEPTPAPTPTPVIEEPKVAAPVAAADNASAITLPSLGELLNSTEQDALGEAANISMGSAATALSTLLDRKVEITTPRMEVTSYRKIQTDYPLPFVVVDVKYTEGLAGTNLLVIRNEDAAVVADLMMGGDGTNPPESLSDIHLSAVGEAMNQMMGSSCTAMSQVLSRRIDISAPTVRRVHLATDHLAQGFENNDDVLIRVSFKAVIGNLVDSEIMQLIPLEFGRELVVRLMQDINKTEQAPVDQSAQQPQMAPQASVPPVVSTPPVQPTAPIPQQQPDYTQQPGFGQPMPNYAPQQPMGYPGYVAPQAPPMAAQPMYYNQQQYPMGQTNPGATMSQPAVTVQPAQFAPLNMGAGAQDQGNIGLIMDVPLQITVELGKTKKTIKDILTLGPGSVVELDKLAGEPVDLLVNGKLLAKGEVVVIDENFGIRVTDIVSPLERVANLQ